MHHREEVVQAGRALREQGYRLTPQRLMILDAVIAGEGHVTAEAIHQTVASEYPDMSPSTVYRTLETLRDLGLVTETDMGSGRVEYHFADQAKHHHLVCRRCGTVAQLPHDFFAPLAGRLTNEYGFQAEMSHFAVFGLCRECSAEGSGAPQPNHHH
jgi:Fur family ferric uptake transcriptional regulator